ncbi:MAG TPA: NmrA family NAD(P)-binding protein [Polyangiaceae bacterium]|nr:NmrA family NAD(P)-binding protein [Polyangiaceae bacterium]
MKKAIVLAGATGKLGSMVARALLDRPDVELRCVVRPGSLGKAAGLAAAGARLFEAGLDAGDRGLAAACEGAFGLVSALQGGPDVIVGGQLALLAAARAAGVRRFLPSDYSFDFFGLGEGENVNSDWRRAFAREAAGARGEVRVVHVLNGCFLDREVLFGFLGMVDLAGGRASLWGEGREPMGFTTYGDTARFAAAAACADEAPPERLHVAGDVLDFAGLVAAYERGSGKRLRVERRGSLADLDAEIARRREAEPHNLFAWLPLMYQRGMLNGKGKPGPLENGRFPEIRPTTVAEYVRAEGL